MKCIKPGHYVGSVNVDGLRVPFEIHRMDLGFKTRQALLRMSWGFILNEEFSGWRYSSLRAAREAVERRVRS